MVRLSVLFQFLPSAFAYYVQETKWNRTSLSGDVVEIHTSGSSGQITVKSSSIDNKDETVKVGYFSGGGSDPDRKSKRPTISSFDVYSSLFSGDAFPSVFHRKKNQDNVEAYFTQSATDLNKIELIVRDSDRPFTVNGSIGYFWGVDKLPKESEEPVDFNPSNDKRIVSFCKTNEMERCAAPIGDFPHVAPFVFLSASGKQLTHFAWLCPRGRICCGWECCDEMVASRILGTILLSLFAILLLIGIGLMMYKDVRERCFGQRRFIALSDSSSALNEMGTPL